MGLAPTGPTRAHTVVAAGTNACVADSTPAYLVDLRTPPADARCAL